MKQPKFLTLLVVSVFTISCLHSCKKIKDAIKVSIPLQTADVNFTIPQITQTGPATLAQVNVAVNVDSIIKASNSKYGVGNIKSVKLSSCDIDMLDGDASNNFSALQSMNVQFSSNTNSSVQTIAEINTNPDVEAYSLSVPANSSIDLKDYFSATSFSYSVMGNARKTTSKPIQCKATFHYTLEVGL